MRSDAGSAQVVAWSLSIADRCGAQTNDQSCVQRYMIQISAGNLKESGK